MATQRFEPIGRTLGRGAFSTVMRCNDHQLKHEVAVKAVKLPKHDPFTSARLMREVAILRELQHPNVIKMYDAIESDSNLLLVLELLRGYTLAKCLRSRGALSEIEVASLAMQLVDAVAFMHAKGVCHRDIKPSNVCATLPVPAHGPLPSSVQWKLLDFGVSRSSPAQPENARSPCRRSTELSERATDQCNVSSPCCSPPTPRMATPASCAAPASTPQTLHAAVRSPCSPARTPPAAMREVSISGTQGYMAPELDAICSALRRSSTDKPLTLNEARLTYAPSLDVFSLGKLLEYALTGADPTRTKKVDQLVHSFARRLRPRRAYRVIQHRRLSAPAKRLLDALTSADVCERATAPEAAAMIQEWRRTLQL